MWDDVSNFGSFRHFVRVTTGTGDKTTHGCNKLLSNFYTEDRIGTPETCSVSHRRPSRYERSRSAGGVQQGMIFHPGHRVELSREAGAGRYSEEEVCL